MPEAQAPIFSVGIDRTTDRATDMSLGARSGLFRLRLTEGRGDNVRNMKKLLLGGVLVDAS